MKEPGSSQLFLWLHQRQSSRRPRPTFQKPTPLLIDHQTLVKILRWKNKPKSDHKSFQPLNKHPSSQWTSLKMIAKTKFPRARSPTDPKRRNNLMRIWWSSLTSHKTTIKWLQPLTLLPKTSRVLIFHKICHHPLLLKTRATPTSPSRTTPPLPKSSSQPWDNSFTSHLFNNSKLRDKCQPSIKWMSLLKWPDLQAVSNHSIRPSTWTASSPSSQRNPLRRPSRSLTSSSLMADGNAASARTITSKEERNATDARSQRLRMIAKVCHNTWLCRQLREPRLKRRVSWRKLRHQVKIPNLKNHHVRRKDAAHPRPTLPLLRKFRRELVTGFARDASITTSPSEMYATCAISATSRATKCSTVNKAKDMSQFKILTNTHSLSILVCRCKLLWCKLHHKWAALHQHGHQSSVTIEYYYKSLYTVIWVII